MNALYEWKNRNILGIKNKFIRIKMLPNGEYQIELSMREKISFQHLTVDVSEIASLITAVQSGESGELDGQPYPNPNGDIYRFNTIAANLEVQFWTKRENALSALIQETMPDGFQDM